MNCWVINTNEQEYVNKEEHAFGFNLNMCKRRREYKGCITMNGTRPKFMENSIINQSYYEQPNPYVNAPSCHVNLLELSRYAKKCGKKLVELTQEEVKKFSI